MPFVKFETVGRKKIGNQLTIVIDEPERQVVDISDEYLERHAPESYTVVDPDMPPETDDEAEIPGPSPVLKTEAMEPRKVAAKKGAAKKGAAKK